MERATTKKQREIASKLTGIKDHPGSIAKETHEWHSGRKKEILRIAKTIFEKEEKMKELVKEWSAVFKKEKSMDVKMAKRFNKYRAEKRLLYTLTQIKKEG